MASMSKPLHPIWSLKLCSYLSISSLSLRKTLSLPDDFPGHCPSMIEEVEESAMEQAAKLSMKMLFYV